MGLPTKAAKKAATKPSKAVAKTPAKRAPSKRAPKVHGPDIPAWRVPGRPPLIYERAIIQPDPTREDLTVGEAIPLMVLQGDRPLKAAQRLCVFPVTLKHWVERGIAEVAAMGMSDPPRDEPSEHEAPYVWVAMGIMRAEAEWEHWAVQLWQAKFPSDWHAVYALLKEREPEGYGQSSRVEVTGAGGGPIRAEVLSVGAVMANLAQVESNWRQQQRELPPIEGTEAE